MSALSEINKTHDELQAATREVATLESQISNLENGLVEANAAVTTLLADDEDDIGGVAQRLAEARAVVDVTDSRIKRLQGKLAEERKKVTGATDQLRKQLHHALSLLARYRHHRRTVDVSAFLATWLDARAIRNLQIGLDEKIAIDSLAYADRGVCEITGGGNRNHFPLIGSDLGVHIGYLSTRGDELAAARKWSDEHALARADKGYITGHPANNEIRIWSDEPDA